MKRAMKQALRQAFTPPAPMHKRAFLRTLPQPRLSTAAFARQQAGAVRGWVWLVSLAILAAALRLLRTADRADLWNLAAMMPFLAVTAVAECARSRTYGMDELEKATRFSLKSVVLARMAVVGLAHLALLAVLLLLGGRVGWAVYLLVPYLLSTLLGLAATRRLRGREALYGCFGAAALVSSGAVLLQLSGTAWLEQAYSGRWLAVLAAVLAATVWESKQVIRQTEELTWN
jgi:hypothetical protein